MDFTDQRLPTIFMSHGAPPLADDPIWTNELAEWSTHIPKPSSVLMVSAHWEEAPLTMGATDTVPLLYDFWGFPQHYYQVTYPAPGAPELARRVEGLLHSPSHPIHHDPERGLDHGAYVPLKEMYPDADIPVLQISMPTLDPAELFSIGQKLAPLRDQGVLLIGSGFSTHNLREMRMDQPAYAPPPAWSAEFDHWLAESLAGNHIDDLIDFQRTAPAAYLAHPRTEHFAPLFVALGAAAGDTAKGETVIDGFWFGLSKRSVQFN